MRTLAYTHDAIKFLKNLDAKQFRQLGLKVFSLLSDPRPNDSIEMKGGKGRFRVDVGEFRIIYRFDENSVSILVIGKRNDGEVYN